MQERHVVMKEVEVCGEASIDLSPALQLKVRDGLFDVQLVNMLVYPIIFFVRLDLGGLGRCDGLARAW